MGSPAGFPWPLRKNYEPIRLIRRLKTWAASPLADYLPSRLRGRPALYPHEENCGGPATAGPAMARPAMARPATAGPAPIKQSTPYPQYTRPLRDDEAGAWLQWSLPPPKPGARLVQRVVRAAAARPARHCSHGGIDAVHDGPPAWPPRRWAPSGGEIPKAAAPPPKSARWRAGPP